MELKGKKWSSDESEKAYMKVTEELVILRQLGKWQGIKEICKILYEKENELHMDTKSVALFHLISVEYHEGNFENAENYLEELRNRMSMPGNADNWITFLEEKYSASAIQRSRGNYQDALKIMEKALQDCGDVPAGFIPAAICSNAASILSKLVDDESFIGVSRKKESFKEKVQEIVERVEYLSNLALQHVGYMNDDFEIAKEELKQRINIELASLYLKSESTNDSLVSSSDIDKAAEVICEAEKSLNLLSPPRLKFNDCRILLAKCDLCLRRYQLKDTGIDNELKTEFLEHLEKARKIAEDYGFEEIMPCCSYRQNCMEKIEKRLKQLNDNEKKIDESKRYCV